ncbi:hypothetical protein BDR26DRAFT_917678 [Obelidium mucronatum]|nr:hypothetical protein BDR26DRAFT_917678 [Obelidium mucronatum]
MDLPPIDDAASPDAVEVLPWKCPHLSANVNLGRVRKAVSARKARAAGAKCAECTETAPLWLCLQCGVAHCGRLANNHALLHHAAHPKHGLAINPDEASVWCYLCDEFIQQHKTRNQVIADVKALFEAEKLKQVRKSASKSVVLSSISKLQKDKDSKRARAKVPVPGLSNLGNTCFFNSVVQCLAYTSALEPYYLEGEASRSSEVVEKALSKSFLNLLSVMRKQLHSGKPNPQIAPAGLFTQLKTRYEIYKYMVQQDAHELLRTLLDGLKEEQRPRSSAEEGSKLLMGPGITCGFVDDAFQGKLVSVVLCRECRGVSYRFEEFLDLSVSLAEVIVKENGTSLGEEKKKFNLLAAMKRTLSGSGSRRSTPNTSLPSSRPATPPLTAESLEQSLASISILSPIASNDTPRTTPSPSDLAQTKLTEQLFRTIDTVRVQQGAAAAAELKPLPANTITLAKCFESFLGCDILEGENGLVCDRCNGVPENDAENPPTAFTKLRGAASAPLLALQTEQKKDLLGNFMAIQSNFSSTEIQNGAAASDEDPDDSSSNAPSDAAVVNYGADDGKDVDSKSINSHSSDETSIILDDVTLDQADILPSIPHPGVEPQPFRIPLKDEESDDGNAAAVAAAAKKNKGKKLTSGYKRYLLHSFPKTLVVHLKRFERVNKSSGRTRKLDTHVEFDEIIDVGMYLSPEEVVEKVKKTRKDSAEENTKSGVDWVDLEVPARLRDPNNGVYRLYGVVVHSGSLFGGHYVAYVRVRLNAEEVEKFPDGMLNESEKASGEIWVYASDSSVRLSSLAEVMKAQAYILFYEHVDGGC